MLATALFLLLLKLWQRLRLRRRCYEDLVTVSAIVHSHIPAASDTAVYFAATYTAATAAPATATAAAYCCYCRCCHYLLDNADND